MSSPASPSETKTSTQISEQDRRSAGLKVTAPTKGAGSKADSPLSKPASSAPIPPSHWRIREFTETIGRGERA